jgi:hypothetical protein
MVFEISPLVVAGGVVAVRCTFISLPVGVYPLPAVLQVFPEDAHVTGTFQALPLNPK